MNALTTITFLNIKSLNFQTGQTKWDRGSIYIDNKKILCVNECIVKSEPYIVPAGPIADLRAFTAVEVYCYIAKI